LQVFSQGVEVMKTSSANHPNFENLTATDAAQLARRLEEDDYADPFAGLDDWHSLRSLAFHRPELAAPYLYLLDMAAYDEP